MRRQAREIRLYGVAFFWVVVLVLVGLGQRWLRRTMDASAAMPVVLDRPLASLPLRVGSWEGADIPLDARIVERAGNDDYINRRYVDQTGNRFVDLFVAYTATPATMIGHRPDRCYPANGWRLVGVHPETIDRDNGSELPCLIHRFERDGMQNEGLVVLNYYVMQGHYTTDADAFSGPGWRAPNLARNSEFYVAQVQIAQPIYLTELFHRGETDARQFASEIANSIESLLPLTPIWQLSHGENRSEHDRK